MDNYKQDFIDTKKMIPTQELISMLSRTIAYMNNNPISIYDLESFFDRYGDDYGLGEVSARYELTKPNIRKEAFLNSFVSDNDL